MAETSAKGRGVPYIAAAGLALGLWAWAMVRLLPRGCAGESDSARVAEPLRVSVNSADESTLQALPGVGGTYARRIVAEREANGAFRRPEDLLRVRGVTRELIEGIEPFISFDTSGWPGEIEDVHHDRAAPSEPPNLPLRPADGEAGSRRTVVTEEEGTHP